jgi:hypothetical protein
MSDAMCIGIVASSLLSLVGRAANHHLRWPIGTSPSASLACDDLHWPYATSFQRKQRVELEFHEFRAEQHMDAKRRQSLCFNLSPKGDLRWQTGGRVVLEGKYLEARRCQIALRLVIVCQETVAWN